MRRLTLCLVLLAVAVSSYGMDSYVFVPRDSNIMSANIELQRALAMRDRYGSHFLWVRHDGRDYVFRDRDVIERIDRLYDVLEVRRPELERLRARMRPLEAREERLDREADAISDDDHHTSADEARLRDLRRQLRDVEAELRVLEREEERLDREQDRLDDEIERKMIPIIEDAIRARAR